MPLACTKGFTRAGPPRSIETPTTTKPAATSTTAKATTTTNPPATTTTGATTTSTTPAAPPPDIATQLTSAITDYYKLMPGDLSDGWNHMTADYQQNHAGGMAGYQSFWGGVASVDVTEVSATPPGTVVATITYHKKDGSTPVERTTFGLVQQDGMWKIASSSVA